MFPRIHSVFFRKRHKRFHLMAAGRTPEQFSMFPAPKRRFRCMHGRSRQIPFSVQNIVFQRADSRLRDIRIIFQIPLSGKVRTRIHSPLPPFGQIVFQPVCFNSVIFFIKIRPEQTGFSDFFHNRLIQCNLRFAAVSGKIPPDFAQRYFHPICETPRSKPQILSTSSSARPL